jgi:hypothetical protein
VLARLPVVPTLTYSICYLADGSAKSRRSLGFSNCGPLRSVISLTFMLWRRASLQIVQKCYFSRLPINMGAISRLLPTDSLLEEDANPDYDPRRFFPARIGETIHRKYQIISKLGWGTGSTVWLAKDINRFVGYSVWRTCVH